MYAELAAVRAELCEPGQLFELEEVEVRGVRVKAWKNAAPSMREFWLQSAGHVRGNMHDVGMALDHKLLGACHGAGL